MASEIYILTKKLVSERQKELVNLVVSWSFISAGPPFESKKYDGSPIRYQGIKFSGSPQQVFWTGYIEPYLENYALEILEQIGKTSYECDVDIERAVEECVTSLNSMVSTVYTRMADVDSRLMGNGFQPAPKRNVSGYVSSMQKTIKDHSAIIMKKYNKMGSDKESSQVTNNFHASVENVQTGNDCTQVNIKNSSKKSVFQWVMDHLVSVVIASVIGGVGVVVITAWFNIGGK